jgi:DNA-binding NarL/FixJ family response regulator
VNEGQTSAATEPSVRVVIVDDGGLNRECLVAHLVAHGVDAGCAWDLPSLFTQIDNGVPNVVLLNIDTPDSATLLQVSLDVDPNVKVIVFGLAADRESEIVACAEAGVAGLHLRSESFDHLLALVRSAGRGQAQCSAEVSAILLRRVYAFAAQANPELSTDSLTTRESEVLALIEQGLSNQQIASRLSLTVHTVKNHVHSLLTKLGVGSRADAVSVARAGRFSSP